METLSIGIKPIQTIKLCSKEECYNEFCRGNKVAIGYLNKNDGAFYSSKQFESEMKNFWANDLKFMFLLKQVKQQLPHTRIKYGVYNNID